MRSVVFNSRAILSSPAIQWLNGIRQARLGTLPLAEPLSTASHYSHAVMASVNERRRHDLLLCNAAQTNLSVFRQSAMNPIIPIGSHPLSLPATPTTATALHPKPELPSQFMFLTYEGYKRIALGQLITPALSAQPAASVADDAIAHALAPERDRMALQIIVNQVGEQRIVFDTWSTSALKKNETNPDLTVRLYANGNNQATGCEINHRGHDSDPLFSGNFTHVPPANRPQTKRLSYLEALPPELKAMFIACIPYASSTLASLGGVSRDMNDVVASKLWVSRLLRRADGIRRSEDPVRDFHAILKESKDISQTHRTAVLMALARNIKQLPNPQSRAQAFADVLKAADTDILSGADKTTVLNALAHKINAFHDLESEILAFTDVLKAADPLQGTDKAAILNALAGTIYWFPDFRKLKAVTDLRNAATPLPRANKAAVLTTLAAKIDWFTDPQSSFAAFTDVLAAAHLLQSADKAAVAAALATNLHTLPNDKIVDAFADVLAVAGTLQGTDKAIVLTALAYKLNHFHAVQPEVEAFTAVQNAADTLQGADKATVLDALDAVCWYDE